MKNQSNKKSGFKSIYKYFTHGDKILIVMLIILGISSYLIINQIQEPGRFVTIKVSGQVKHHLNIDKNQTIVVSGPVGKTVIRIQDKKVRVLKSDCPHKICEKSGWINKSMQLLVCVPNKVIINIEGKQNQHFDVITQ